MTQTIARVYDADTDARSAASELKKSGFSVRLISSDAPGRSDATGGDAANDDVVGAIESAGVAKSAAAAYADSVRKGGAVVTVRPPFGGARRATAILDSFHPADGGMFDIPANDTGSATARARTRHIEAEGDAAPRSSGSGTPTLTNEAAPLSRLLGLPVLLNSPAPLSKRLGWRVLVEDPAPLSRKLGWPLLSNEPAPLSRRLGLPVLIRDGAPPSSKLGLPPSTNSETPPATTGQVAALSDDSAPLSNERDAPTLAKDPAPPSRAFDLPVSTDEPKTRRLQRGPSTPPQKS